MTKIRITYIIDRVLSDPLFMVLLLMEIDFIGRLLGLGG